MSTNDNNDAGPADELQETASEPTVETRQSLGAKIRRHSKKIIIGVVVLALITVVFRGGRKEEVAHSSMGVRPPNKTLQDPNMVDPLVADKLKDRDAANAGKLLSSPDAIKSGASYLPKVTNENADPLADYAKASAGTGQPVAIPVPPSIPPPIAMPPKQTPTPVAPLPTAAATPKGDPRYITLAKAMRKSLAPERLVIDMKYQPVEIKFAEAKPPAVAASGGEGGKPSEPPPPRIAKLGDLFYATMDLEANSDYSPFVQATVIGGPMDGAKMQGSFRRTLDRLEIQFTRASWRGKTLSVSAIATNPDQPEVGLATDVNSHYLSRFGGLFVSAFIKGYGDELKREGTMVTVNPDTGTISQSVPDRSDKDLAIIAGSEVADELSTVFKQGLDRPPTVIVAASTPIGILLRADVLDKTAPQQEEAPPKELPAQITPSPFPAQAAAQAAQTAIAATQPVQYRTIDEYATQMTTDVGPTTGPTRFPGYPETYDGGRSLVPAPVNGGVP